MLWHELRPHAPYLASRDTIPPVLQARRVCYQTTTGETKNP